MKKRLTFLITVMLLISSMMTSFVPVNAEEDLEVVDESTTETAEISEDEEENVVIEAGNSEETKLQEDEQQETASEETEEPEIVAEKEEETAISEEEAPTVEEETAISEEEAQTIEEETAEEKTEATDEELVEMETGEHLFEEENETNADKAPTNWDPELAIHDDYIFFNIGKSDTDAWMDAAIRSDKAYAEFVGTDGTVFGPYMISGFTRESKDYLSSFYFYGHMHGLQIDLRKLIDDKMPGGKYTIKVYVPGYTTYEKTVNIETLPVRNNTQKNALQARLAKLCIDVPDDINVQFTDQGDMVITSNDLAWLEALAKPKCKYITNGHGQLSYITYANIPTRTDFIGGGYIMVDGIKFENTGVLSSVTDPSVEPTDIVNSYTCDTANKRIVISKTALEAKGIVSGRHAVELSAEGYLVYSLENTVLYSANDVSVAVESNGDVVISASNADYINNLANVNDKRTAYVSIAGSDRLFGDQITNKNGTAVISSKDIKVASNNQITGEVEVVIKSKGFDAISKTIALPYIVADGSNDDGSIAVFMVPKTYRVDASSVIWSVLKNNNGQYAVASDSAVEKIISGNKLTINAKEVGSYRIQAISDGITDTKDVVVTAEGLSVTAPTTGEAFVGQTTKMGAKATIKNSSLDVEVTSSLTYSSDDESVATVASDGTITFLKKGTVSIIATIGTAQAETKYTVYAYNPNGKFEAVLSGYDIQYGMETNEEYQIVASVDGKEVTDKSLLSYKSAKATTASVDANGVVKGLKKGDGVVITVTLNEGKKLTTTIKIDVKDKVFTSMELDANVRDSEKEVVDGVLNIAIDSGEYKTVQLTAKGEDKKGEIFEMTAVKYTSSDTSTATVNSSGLVTIKKSGSVTITATDKSNVSLSESVVIKIVDLTPKLSTNKVTLNKYKSSGEIVKISAAYQDYSKAKVINKVEITGGYKLDYDAVKEEFALSLPESMLASAKSGKQLLTVTMVDGSKYNFDFTVNIVAKLPSITVKTTGSLNIITNEGELGLTYSSKDAEESDVSVSFPGNWAAYDSESGVITLKDPSIKSGNANFLFEGYNTPVTKKVTFKTVKTKPSVKLDTSSITIYDPNGTVKTKETVIRLIDNKKEPITEGILSVTGNGNTITGLDENGYATITIKDFSTPLIVKYKGEEKWFETIDNKISVKVSKTLPVAKFAASALVINTKHNPVGKIAIGTTFKTEEIVDVKFSGTNEDFVYGFENGMVTVKLAQTAEVKKGSYKVTVTPLITGGVELKPLSLTIKVEEGDPKVSLKPTTVKLNKLYNEIISVTPSLPKNLGYDLEIADVNAVAEGTDVANITFNSETGDLDISLKNAKSTVPGKYVYSIKPVFSNGKTSDTAIKLTVSVLEKAATVKFSMKGDLNQLSDSSVVSGTVKLSGVDATVEDVTSASSLVDVIYEDGVVEVSLKNRNIADQKLSVPVKVKLSDNIGVVDSTLTVSVKRKTPTVKASPTSIQVYDTTNNNRVVGIARLQISGVKGASIKEATATIDKSTGAYKVEIVDERIIVTLLDSSKLKSGSTQNIVVKIDWVGDVGPKLKTSTVKISIKDTSHSIKCR